MPGRRSLVALFSLLLLTGLAAAQARRAPAPRKRAPVAAAPQKSKYKAIFEPANYNQDVKLFSVYCADENSCWAAGGTRNARSERFPGA